MTGQNRPLRRVALLITVCELAGCAERREPGPSAGDVRSVEPTLEGPAATARTGESEAPAAGGEWANSIGMRFRVIAPLDVVLEAPREGPLDQLSAREQFMRQARGDPPLPPGVRRPARVTRAFAISICEVTGADMRTVLGRDGGEDEPERPISGSWEEATEFCRRLSEPPEERQAGRSYRVPTQAEWLLPRVEECYPSLLSDRHVTVWNWSQDLFDPEYYRRLPEHEPTVDPKGAAAGKSHVVLCDYSHPDPFRHLMAFRVVTDERGGEGRP